MPIAVLEPMSSSVAMPQLVKEIGCIKFSDD